MISFFFFSYFIFLCFRFFLLSCTLEVFRCWLFKLKMEEDDDDEATLTQFHPGENLSHTGSQPSIYRSTQTNINRNSQSSLYKSFPGSLYRSTISINSMASAVSTTSVHSAYSGDSVTARAVENSLMDGNSDEFAEDDAGRGIRLVS